MRSLAGKVQSREAGQARRVEAGVEGVSEQSGRPGGRQGWRGDWLLHYYPGYFKGLRRIQSLLIHGLAGIRKHR